MQFHPFLVLFSFVFVNCPSVADSQLFTPCNGKSSLNGSCDLNEDCENKGSICLRGKCRCHPHYIEVVDDKRSTRSCKPCKPLSKKFELRYFVSVPSRIGSPCTTKCREPLFCRNGECQCVVRGTTTVRNGECFTSSRVGDRCSRHYDCTSPFSACLNHQCVCITGTIQQGDRCVAAANCPLGGLPGQSCTRRTDPSLAFNLPSDQDNCPLGQVCVTPSDSPLGHCCPVVCPLASHADTKYTCHPNATGYRCPSDTHFCHFLSDGGFSQAVCCRRPCNALAPNALYTDNKCVPRGQLNSGCITNAQCGGGEAMQCIKGQCQCLDGFHPAVDDLTHPMTNPSQTCSRDCQNERLSKDTSCMKPVSLGSQCFVQRQCPKDSGCYRGRCMCRCGFEAKGDKCVERPPPPTSAPSSNQLPLIPNLPKTGDLFSLVQGFLGGNGAPQGGGQPIGSIIG
ncbi:hypothetical protein WR25_24750 [Diploscapter pachys]|uniref:EB domain-containing protein n=1 Tax=Diploscapter pachys TaxID=2018661 RepID=A0A2A2KQ54_9BILA|nr:hypothetical protein WR25_24750 [Diploscapter pachys]